MVSKLRSLQEYFTGSLFYQCNVPLATIASSIEYCCGIVLTELIQRHTNQARSGRTGSKSDISDSISNRVPISDL